MIVCRRIGALYGFFALILLLSLLLVLSTSLNWPFMLLLSTTMLLALLTFGFIVVVVTTAGLKIGNDGYVL